VRLTLRDGADASMTLRLAGEEVELSADEPVERPWKRRPPLLPAPGQPVGREPAGRGH
jgi:hypothetical protein